MMSEQSSITQAFEAASSGDTKTATAILRDLIKQNPGDIDAWLALADIVEKPEQAKQCLERVLQIDPNNQIAQQKLHGEQPSEFDFLFESVEEPDQEPEENQPGAPVLDFSTLYDQEDQTAQSSFEQSQPQQIIPDQDQTQDPAPKPPPPPVEGARRQRPRQPKPTRKKPVQKKEKRFSGIEIALVVVIVFMCLCLCAIGFASLGKNTLLESLEYSDILVQETTELSDDVTAVIYENIRASNVKDFDGYMMTIHSNSPSYNLTKETIETAFSDQFNLSYKVSDVYIIEQGSNKAVVHFVLTTRLTSGSISFRDNQVEGEMTLRKENGSWKIYDQKVLNIEYLD